MLTLTVESAYDGASVDTVLRTAFLVSESYQRRLKRRKGSVLINGEPVYLTARVRIGDVLSFDPSDPEKLPIRPNPFPLDLIYEDEWLAVVNKPNGLCVHPARNPEEPTVENALAAHFSGTDNPHPVSRLDKGTTGLMTVAKSGYIHARLKLQQASGDFRKTYLAILDGVPTEQRFIIDAPISPLPGSTYQRTVCPDGAPSKSECALLAENGGAALVRLIPHTGRTHQLRVHMAYAGTPILGDWLYGKRCETVNRPLLHAHTLAFTHPITKELMQFTAPMPDDFRTYFPLFM